MSSLLEEHWGAVVRLRAGQGRDLNYNLLKIHIFIYLFLEQEGEGGRKRQREHQRVVDSLTPPTGYLAHNGGMCPDWESNQRPFSLQASAQSTEPHQPGPGLQS